MYWWNNKRNFVDYCKFDPDKNTIFILSFISFQLIFSSLKLSKHASKLMQSKIIQNYVQKYVENNTDPFWVDDLVKYI